MRAASTTQVVIAGAGPTGLTLACELARRHVAFRLVDAASGPFQGSRGKGLQPRTLEVFDDLGIVDRVLAAGGRYPRLRLHVWRLSIGAGRMDKAHAPTPTVPYPSLWMVPQWRTEELLRERLEELGGRVEFGTRLTAFAQDDDGVTAALSGADEDEQVRAELLVGCDGGHSFVRKQLPVRFEGEAIEGQRVVLADVEIEGLDRVNWHVWPLAKGGVLTLCPLPGTPCYQLAAPLRGRAVAPDLTEDDIRRFVDEGTGGRGVRVTRARWMSLYRPQVRMVDRYRVGRVFLAGDAAHVHPPAGGQGLNTGVQDAYNLGWKLAHALKGAPDSLLSSYETERLPIAAAVLGLSERLFRTASPRRGAETQQLDLHYRDSALTHDTRAAPGALRAGDRAPDAPCANLRGEPTRVFDVFRGPHFTLLAFGAAHADIVARAHVRWGSGVRAVRVVSERVAPEPCALVDTDGHARAAYDIQDEALVLVRPDGHVGLFSSPGTLQEVDDYLARTSGLSPDQSRPMTSRRG